MDFYLQKTNLFVYSKLLRSVNAGLARQKQDSYFALFVTCGPHKMLDCIMNRRAFHGVGSVFIKNSQDHREAV